MSTDEDCNTLHPWIAPELEARLTALVLGEASDFERDELERLVAERAELGLYRKRLEVMHRMLHEVAQGESGDGQGEWRLSGERREKVLAQLSGSPSISNPKMPPVTRRSPWSISSRFLAVAATIMIVGLMLGLMFPASTGALRSKGTNVDVAKDTFVYDSSNHVRERMVRRIDEGRETTAPSNAVVDVNSEARQPAPADRAIRPPVTTSATPAPPAEPMVVNNSGQIGALNGTLALGAGGDIALSTEPNSPAKISVAASGNRSTNVRVGGDFGGRNAGRRPLAEEQVTSTLGGENTNSGGTAITGGGVLAITNSAPAPAAAPAVTPATTYFSAVDTPEMARDLRDREMTVNPSKTMSAMESKGTGDARRDAVPRQAGAEKVEGEKRSPYEFGTTEIELAETPATEIPRGLLPPQSPPLAASPKPVSAAPVSGPAVADSETQLMKQGAGTLALNGGTVAPGLSDEIVEADGFINHKRKNDAPVSAPGDRGNLNFTGDLQVSGGAGAEANAAMNGRIFGSGGAAGAAGGNEVSGGFAFESPANPDALSRSARSGAEAGQDSDVSRMGRSGAVEKSLSQATDTEVKRENTDLNTTVFQVPPTFLSTERPGVHVANPFADPVSAGGGAAPAGRVTAKQILESAGISFPEGTTAIYNAETSQLIVRNTPDQTELVEAFVDSVAGSDEKEGEPLFTRHFSGGANSLRGFDYRDAGERSEVDKSVQDILALTPQFGKDITEDKEAMDALFAVVPQVAGGGAESGRRLIDSNVSAPSGALYPSLDTVVVRSEKITPAALAETSPEAEPFSTFSLHVSDVSFQLAKAALAAGKWPEADKIRIEEFVNAFDYGDPVPSMGERVACRIDQGAHPFLQQRNLVRIALRTAEAGRSPGTPLRLTLLLDSSGSMERPDRRATLTRAVATLAGLLGENDRITLVSFARQPRLVADAVAGNEAIKLAGTVASLPSEGGTNLEAALELAFEKAREHQEPNAQNRIVLLTDGAANLGDARAGSLGARVEMMREAGVAFDAAGFGAEGLNDEILEALTRKGDGRYYLLDRPEDAGEAFAEQIAGALRPAAKNVKVQVEFNPDRVKSYKLLGFEKHRLATEDFRNDAVDAAELAAAEAGVAVYQVEPDPAGEGDLGSVSVRFRDLESGEMIERRWALPHLAAAPRAGQGGDPILLATVASQFAAKLAGGPLGDVVDLGELASLAAELPESPRVNELRSMIEQARGIEGRQ